MLSSLRKGLVRRSTPLSKRCESSVSYKSLENGVMCASQEMGGYVASVGVVLGRGSRHETPETNGISAVVHAAGLKEAQKQIAKLGGSVTGTAGRETTTFVATVLKEHAGQAAAVLSSIVSKPPSSGAFEEAKAQMIAENVLVPMTDAEIIEEMQQCAFLDTAMGMPVAGTPASLSSLTIDDVPAPVIPMVATAGGDLTDVAAAFEGLSGAGGLPATQVPAAPKAIFTGSDKKMYYESHPVARFAFAYEFPSLDSEHAAACRLLPYLLAPASTAMTSPDSLYEPFNSHVKLTRDHAEQKCAESSTPFYIPFTDSALFGISLAAKDVRVEDCAWYTTTNLVRLCFEVSEAELARAKLAFQADLLHSFASPTNVVSAYLDDLGLIGRVVPPSELVQRVTDLQLKQIKDLAYTFIHDNDHALAAVGPLHELPDYNWFRTATYNYHY